MNQEKIFPEIISNLPEADISREECAAYLLQGESQQIIFMSYDKELDVPEHSHEAQWGAVLDGQIEMTIEGKTTIFIKGDTYFIPKGAKHSAKIFKGYKAVTLFDQKDRYKAK